MKGQKKKDFSVVRVPQPPWLPASEEVDVLSIEGGDFGDDSPLHVPAYEELVEVVSRTYLNISININDG